jgi:hypothetical protein
VKPDVAAPGIAIRSAGAGLGTGGVRLSGTSMAAPHVSGVAALVLQGHPAWPRAARPGLVRAAIMNTADGDLVDGGNDPRVAGAGIVQARRAADTLASATTGPLEASLSFGHQALGGPFAATRTITIANAGPSPITYALSAAFAGAGLAATVSVAPSTITVPPGGRADAQVTLSLDVRAVAALPDANGSPGAVTAIGGSVTATPLTIGPGVYPLRVPFLLVPRGLSNMTVGPRSDAVVNGRQTTTVGLANEGVHTGSVDVFAWGLDDPADSGDAGDVRAIGVASLPGGAAGGTPEDRTIVFAVSAHGRWSNPAELTIDIPIDVDGDARPDFRVVGGDSGAVLDGSPNGRMAAFTFTSDGRLVAARAAAAPANGSVLLLPALASDLGLRPPGGSGGARVIAYGASVISPGRTSPVVDQVTGQATFDPFQPRISQGQHVELAPGARTSLQLSVDADLPAAQRPLGWLLVSPNDAAGAGQADEVPLLPAPR